MCVDSSDGGACTTAWDLRAFKKPVATRTELATLYPGTNAILSPDEKYVVTGSGATTKGGAGKIHFLKRDTLEVVQELEMVTSVVKVHWHSKINQVRRGASPLYPPSCAHAVPRRSSRAWRTGRCRCCTRRARA